MLVTKEIYFFATKLYQIPDVINTTAHPAVNQIRNGDGK